MIKNIFLVDDSPVDSMLSMEVLCNIEGAETTAFRDGVSLVAHLTQQPLKASTLAAVPSLIILDYNMPKLNALEVLQLIKGTPSLNHVPVVIFTSSEHEEDIMHSYKNGASAYVTKPFGLETYKTTLKMMADFWINANRDCPVVIK